MNINRHNYETFFLLYVDNELTSAERESVDAFVAENPDLQPELQLLLETVLPAENISFAKSDSLLKEDEHFLQLQEKLILLLDDELSSSDAQPLLTAIETNETARSEYLLLQQTKLDKKDQQVFPFKDQLYRHTGSRVVQMRIIRIAAAAVLFLALLLAGLGLFRKATTVNDPMAHNPVKEIRKSNSNQVTQHKPVEIAHEKITGQQEVLQPLPSNNPTSNIVTATINNPSSSQPVKKEFAIHVERELPVNEDKNIPLENINNLASNKKAALTVTLKKREVTDNNIPAEIAVRSKEKITAPVISLEDPRQVKTTPGAMAAAYDESPNNDNHVFYVSEERIARSKIGGLFRKVKQVVERTANISTGNGITIGNFEIALNK